MRIWKRRVMTFSCLVDSLCSSRDGSNTYMMFGTHAAYGIVLEELAREQPGRETLEAPYFAGPELVEETSECLCLLTNEDVLRSSSMGCSTNLMLCELAGYVTCLE
jgi:hypothetical protein